MFVGLPQPMDLAAVLRGEEPLLKVRLTHLRGATAATAEAEAPDGTGHEAAGGSGGGGCILALTIHHAVLGELTRAGRRLLGGRAGRDSSLPPQLFLMTQRSRGGLGVASIAFPWFMLGLQHACVVVNGTVYHCMHENMYLCRSAVLQIS